MAGKKSTIWTDRWLPHTETDTLKQLTAGTCMNRSMPMWIHWWASKRRSSWTVRPWHRCTEWFNNTNPNRWMIQERWLHKAFMSLEINVLRSNHQNYAYPITFHGPSLGEMLNSCDRFLYCNYTVSDTRVIENVYRYYTMGDNTKSVMVDIIFITGILLAVKYSLEKKVNLLWF